MAIKRIRPPEPEQTKNINNILLNSSKVKTVINILNKVENKFNSNKPRDFSKYGIIEKSSSKYFIIMKEIFNFAVDIKTGYNNPVEKIIEDYLISVFKYYAAFKRLPYLNQIAPSVDNKIRFQEFIDEFEENNESKYWFDNKFDYEILKNDAFRIAEGIIKAREVFQELPESITIEVV